MECVHRISGLYQFSFGYEVWRRQAHKNTDIYTSKKKEKYPAYVTWILKTSFNDYFIFVSFYFWILLFLKAPLGNLGDGNGLT